MMGEQSMACANDGRQVPLIGLAPLVRKAFDGAQLDDIWHDLQARIAADPEAADALMDMSTILRRRESPPT